MKPVGVIFDLDLTLVDSKLAESHRNNRDWGKAYAEIPNFTLYEGIKVVIEFLDENNIPYCIVTSSPSSYCSRVCNHWGISSKHMVCYHDTTRKKPYPDPIQAALERLKLPPKNVISFGDRDIDIIASKRAGVISVACHWGAEDKDALERVTADYSIQNAKEIIHIVNKICISD